MKHIMSSIFCSILFVTSTTAQDNELSLEERAMELYNKKEYKEAGKLYGSDYPFDAARCYALLGEKQKAISFISLSIRNGYSYSEFMLEQDFDNLNSLQSFHNIVEVLSH